MFWFVVIEWCFVTSFKEKFEEQQRTKSTSSPPLQSLESSPRVPLELFVSGVEAQRFQCSICLDVALEPVYHSKQDEVC